MTECETVDVELSPRDRQLILDYGYPFDRIEAAIEEYRDRPNWEIVALDRFELEWLIGDLSYSINKRTTGDLQMELYDLCERLEDAEIGRVW